LYVQQAKAADNSLQQMPEPVHDKAKAEYLKAMSIWEDVLKDDPEALADKYQEAAVFFSQALGFGETDPEDQTAYQDLMKRQVKLRREIHGPLERKAIGPPNPGGDPQISAQLPVEGKGYFVFNKNLAHIYGRPELINLVTSVAAAWTTRHPNQKLVVGDLSQRGGGPLPPHGDDHQDGREVDIWAISNTGASEPTNIFAPNYSRELTTELIKLIQQVNPQAVVYFDDGPLAAAGLVRATVDHSNYLHVILP